MTTTMASVPAQTARPLRSWLSVRHPLPVELASVLALYGVYEATRGLAAGGAQSAVRHAQDVVSLERSLHVFVEPEVQQAAEHVPGLIGTLGVAYITLHLAGAGGLLLWLHRRRPDAYPFVRTTLLFASTIALLGYLLFPTAPPRLSGLGIVDTVSGGQVDLNKGLVSSLYNPYAAVPSMHAGYAVVVGASLMRYGGHALATVVGLAYPAFVVFVIAATGNHFFFDAAAGAAVCGVAALGSWLLVTRPFQGRPNLRALDPFIRPMAEAEQKAA